MIIPGFVITLATFPGVIVHEAAHLLFCKLRGVPVLDVRFFQLGNPAGYVQHETPSDFLSSLLISTGPFTVNSLFCMLICFPIAIPWYVFGLRAPLDLVLCWLGVSIGMHAFPSTGDASVLWHQARQAARQGSLLALLSMPLVGLIYLANVLNFFWLDYLYGIFIGLILPAYVFNYVF